MNFTLTPAAERFIRRLLRFDGGPGSGFRLVVTPGGCSGLAANFSIESAPQTGDALIELSGIKFFLPAESRLMLEDVTVDFAETPTQSGFVFHDPKNNSGACSSRAAELAGPADNSVRH